MDKVDQDQNPNDNCQIEFMYAHRRKAKHLVPVRPTLTLGGRGLPRPHFWLRSAALGRLCGGWCAGPQDGASSQLSARRGRIPQVPMEPRMMNTSMWKGAVGAALVRAP